MMCISFPPIGWWWSAVLSLALLSWVLVHPKTTLAGGFGYGLLFGLGFYIPLLPWISGLVGPVPWLMLAALQALFVGVFGMFAVVVRRLPGWPLWLALLWAMQEWLKSSVPFGGFPWGVVGFGQTQRAVPGRWSIGRRAAAVLRVALLGTSLCALALEIARWWQHSGPDKRVDGAVDACPAGARAVHHRGTADHGAGRTAGAPRAGAVVTSRPSPSR